MIKTVFCNLTSIVSEARAVCLIQEVLRMRVTVESWLIFHLDTERKAYIPEQKHMGGCCK